MTTATPARRHDGRVVGHVANGELVLARKRSRHWLRVANGWSVDVAVLAQAAALGATHVVVVDRESGTRYVAPLDAFREHGVHVSYGGHGAQLALPARFWSVERPDAALQLALFA